MAEMCTNSENFMSFASDVASHKDLVYDLWNFDVQIGANVSKQTGLRGIF